MKKILSFPYKKYFFLFLIFFICCFGISLFFVPTPLSRLPYSQIIVDRYGKEIGEIAIDGGFRHQKMIPQDLPEFTQKVIIALEDDSFYQNIGIDLRSIVRAAYRNFKAGEVREGASTITTQLVKNLYWLNKERTWRRKCVEIYLSLAYTVQHKKIDILNAYLETIFFGYQNYGLASASQFYFGKDIQNLTQAEQIALLVIPKNSNSYDPFKHKYAFQKRYHTVSEYLKKKGVLSEEEYAEIQKERLLFTGKRKNMFPYLSDFFQNQNNNSKNYQTIQTTIDEDLQKSIEEIARKSIIPLAWKNVGDFSVIIVDKQTMELRALVGGNDYSGKGGQVNGALAPRQVGSAIKPFTYLLAFQNLGYTPETTISDIPTQFLTDKGYAYTPKNYSLTYKGEITLAEALSQSINVPAIKIAEKVGVKKLLDFLQKLGITTLKKDEDYYGLALTLGVGEISLYELTQAYSIFSNDGKFCPIISLQNAPKNCTPLVDSKYTDMINTILSDRYIKIREFPLYGNLDFADKTVMLKTGTSRNFKDNWTIGVTDHYLIGVWVGNKDGQEMRGVSGASGAGEIFKNIVEEIEGTKNYGEITMQKRISTPYLQITSPLSQSVYQIDESTPLFHQKIPLTFETNIVYDSVEWYIDGTLFPEKFYQLEEGKKVVKIIIKKDGNIQKEYTSTFTVQLGGMQ